jgi:hypothetical protein
MTPFLNMITTIFRGGNKRYYWVFIMSFILLVRVVNLDYSARFTRDESSDLKRMHSYYVDRKISLVGPVSSDNKKVFSSLTYYMLMPFAIAGKFDPVAPAYGMVFWGTLTALFMLLITHQFNTQFHWLTGLLVVIWTPLLESSRWAWNPHLTPFWMTVAIFSLLKPSLPRMFFGGLAVAMAGHNHYLALVSGIVLLSFISFRTLSLINAKRLIIPLWLGLLLGLLPFLLFDLKNPPGLFLGAYLRGNNLPSNMLSSENGVLQLIDALWISGLSLTGTNWLGVVSIFLILVLLVNDFLKHRRNCLWMIPAMGQWLTGYFLVDYQTRYFLPAVVFVYVWLIQKRKGLGKRIQLGLLVIFIGGSLIKLPTLLTQPAIPPNIKTIRHISDIISGVIETHSVVNPNILTAESPDLDLLSLKYRDLLAIKGIFVREPTEYDSSENLFVISTSSENTVRKSNSIPMTFFKDSVLRSTYEIENSRYRVYWFSFSDK